jgi:hypothetical protein
MMRRPVSSSSLATSRSGLILLILAALATTSSLAYASPPDPSARLVDTSRSIPAGRGREPAIVGILPQGKSSLGMMEDFTMDADAALTTQQKALVS